MSVSPVARHATTERKKVSRTETAPIHHVIEKSNTWTATIPMPETARPATNQLPGTSILSIFLSSASSGPLLAPFMVFHLKIWPVPAIALHTVFHWKQKVSRPEESIRAVPPHRLQETMFLYPVPGIIPFSNI